MKTVKAATASQSRRQKDGDGVFFVLDALLVAAAAFVLALLGLASKPPHAFPTFWPVCPALLAGFILRPRWARPPYWGIILLVLAMTDHFLMQVTLPRALALNSIDIAGMAVGYWAFRRIFGEVVDFTRPRSMIRLCLVAFAMAMCEGVLVGVFSVVVSEPDWAANALEWFSVEFLSCMTLLPLFLSAPDYFSRGPRMWRVWLRRPNLHQAAVASLPCVLLAASFAVSFLVEGEGAIAFPVIALSYCALSYSVFTTSLLVVIFTVWTTLAAVTGVLPVLAGPDDAYGLVSLHLAIASIALAPLIIASATAAQGRVLAQWRLMADSDSLTDVLNSRGFFRAAKELLHTLREEGKPVAVLMMDIDFFKRVNDSYGHGAGDKALAVVSGLLRQGLREGDICGRLGGEEFAAILAGVSPGEASAIAERIRASIASCLLSVEGPPMRLTASFGVAFFDPASVDLQALLHVADQALYQAKRNGRNRVHLRTGVTA
ncbi:diguanylate cyclase OS=Castellaniella defragrans OX=75697 GN=HNR28_000804 PE=4 SV=1 [Castellaniella defragrans]